MPTLHFVCKNSKRDYFPSFDCGSTEQLGTYIPLKLLPESHLFAFLLSTLLTCHIALANFAKEVHIMHAFPADFYDAHMSLLILGFIRPEYDYVSKESLIEDIQFDIEVARRSLDREGYGRWRRDEYLTRFQGQGDVAS